MAETFIKGQQAFKGDGWQRVTDAWTYASASTINVPSGAASLYQKGDRIKWTQTTVKYGVIVAVADTLLTIAVNTDYVVANAAITNIYFSHELNPLGYPHWFNYTPTWGGFSSNPTGGVTRFNIIGNLCTVERVSGGAGISNATTMTMSLPVTAAQSVLLMCIVGNNSATVTTPGLVSLGASATATFGLNLSAVGGFTASNFKDVTGMTITYEI